MKKLIIIIAAIFAGGVANAQKVHELYIPKEVKMTFEKSHREIKDEKWTMDNGNYQAEFKDGENEETFVTIDPKGNFISSKTKIQVSELPKEVNNYITKKYEGEKITDAIKITDALARVTYKAEVKKQYLTFDSDGSFIKVAK